MLLDNSGYDASQGHILSGGGLGQANSEVVSKLKPTLNTADIPRGQELLVKAGLTTVQDVSHPCTMRLV